ncbi:MAG: hypothetical protein V1701_10770 [Planctomycetota bacterium]
MVKRLVWISIIGLIVLAGCRIATGVTDRIENNVKNKANEALTQLEKAIGLTDAGKVDNEQLGKTLEMVRDLLREYQETRTQMQVLSVYGWLVCGICCLLAVLLIRKT